ncbi:MAG: hypothetical protein ABEJ30_03145 [Halorientalis sp.]
MSQSNPPLTDSALSQSDSSTLAWLGTWVREWLEATAFWAAVVLPVVYLPLLATGLDERTMLLFVGLLALNCLALVFGHAHNRDRAESADHA